MGNVFLYPIAVVSLLMLCQNLGIKQSNAPHNKSHWSEERSTNRAYAPDRVLVSLKEGIRGTLSANSAIRSALPTCTLVKSLGCSDAEDEPAYIVELARNVSVQHAIQELSRDTRIEFVEPDYTCYLADTIPNDPFFEYMWPLNNHPFGEFAAQDADIGAVPAWDITTGSDDIVVAVLDTGAELTHPDLAANAWVNRQEIPNNQIDDDANGRVDDINGWNFIDNNNRIFEDAESDYHGTHVAGITGAVGDNNIGVTGVAWRVELMSLKILDGAGKDRGLTSNAIQAIYYAIDQKKRGNNIVAINASWISRDRSRALRRAIEDAGRANIMLVCAAGNDALDLDIEPVYPAAHSARIDSVISVAAVNSDGILESYSNYGHETVQLGAPGTGVLGLAPLGEYQELSGTSMAAPHVAGVIVLLLAGEPGLSSREIKQRLMLTADSTPTLAAYTTSAGRVNAFSALTFRTSPASRAVIGRVHASKRFLEVDGLGFLLGSSQVELNGRLLPRIKYKHAYTIVNGSLTRLIVKLGTDEMNRLVPLDVEVSLTVVDPVTGERSEPFLFTRKKDNFE